MSAVSQEEPGVLGNTLLEALVFGEVGLNGHISAFDEFLGRGAHRAQWTTALDAKQVLRRANRMLAPTGLDNRLGDRHGRRHPGRRHGALRQWTDELDELLLRHQTNGGPS